MGSSLATLAAAAYRTAYRARGIRSKRPVIAWLQAGRVTLLSEPSVLLTGPTETRFHRAGNGPPLVLLFAAGPAEPLAAALFAGLCAQFRVIAPVLPDGVGDAVPLSRWLRDLLDGIGVERPWVVADEPLAGAVLAVMMAAPGRIGGAVAIGRDHAEAAETVADHLDRSGRDLALILVDDRADPARAAAEAVVCIRALLAPGR